MISQHHIDVFWFGEDHSWLAHGPDLQTCAAHAGLPEEAVAEVLGAIGGWLEVVREHGEPAPEPRGKPAAQVA